MVKSFSAPGPDLVLPPENPLQVHHPLLDRHAVGHLNRERANPVAAEDPVARGLKRNEDLLVRIAEAAGRSLLAEDADDLEGDAPDQSV